MKKLAIPAILAFWVIIIVVGMLVMSRRDPPPPPPDPGILTPANIAVTQDGRGTRSVVVTTQSGEDVEFLRPDGGRLEYLGPVEGKPYHLVSLVTDEDQEWTTVVDERSGEAHRMAGTVVPSADNRRLGSAGSSGAAGYSWVDVVEFGEDGLEPAVHLDALRHGLWAESVSWTKSGALMVTGSRGYAGLCDAPEAVEILLDRDSSGVWITWLDDARSVKVMPDGSMSVEVPDVYGSLVDGRFIGQRQESYGPRSFFDPDWTPLEDPEEPAVAARVTMVPSEMPFFDGWPVPAPEPGYALAVGTLPCRRTPGREPIQLFGPSEGGLQPVATFDPVEMGWSSRAVAWDASDRLAVQGWIPGGLHSPRPGTWLPTHTGAFVQTDSVLVEAAVEPASSLELTLRSGLTATLPSSEAPTAPFRYLGFSDALDAHLVRSGTGAAGAFVLIDDATARAWPLSGVPIPTESGLRFATAREDQLGNYDVAVYEWSSSGGAVRTWLGSVPTAETDSIYWDGEDRLLLSTSQAVSIRKGSNGEWRKRER